MSVGRLFQVLMEINKENTFLMVLRRNGGYFIVPVFTKSCVKHTHWSLICSLKLTEVLWISFTLYKILLFNNLFKVIVVVEKVGSLLCVG